MRFHRQVAGKEDIRFWESEMRLNVVQCDRIGEWETII